MYLVPYYPSVTDLDLREPLELRSLIKSEADQCVKCGLCLPHCPTYRKTQDEGDSPRGRIALMQALADNRLPAQGRLTFHLDRCLACRACERACPSGVHYGLLIDTARALLGQSRQGQAHQRATWLHTMLLAGVGSGQSRRYYAGRLLRLYQSSGLRWLARRSGLLRWLGLGRLDSLLPTRTPGRQRQEYYPPGSRERGRVALFTGCMTDIFGPDTLDASIRLLTLAGYGVHLPPAQTCCGAMHLHAGDLARAAGLAQRNLTAFNALELDAVLYTASGCGTTLREYSSLPARDNGTSQAAFTAPVMDVTQFLAGIEWPAGISFEPLARRAVVQDPCLQRNVLRDVTPPYRLLEQIPGLNISALPGNDQCCGAAGTYMLEQPELSDVLRADKLEAVQQSGAEILVTSNIGCAIHLAAGLRLAKSEVEVIHPVRLLERQLKAGS